MNRERFAVLAAFLRTVPEDRFDLATWAGSDERPWRGAADLSCGTVACAAGWATTIPAFKEQGLCLKPDPSPGIGRLWYGMESGNRALLDFFEIGPEAADHIFYKPAYNHAPSPSEVADRIKELLGE